MQLKSNDRTLRQILSSYYFFIPRFQRPYSWTQDNVEELWEDAISDSSGDYFVGSMVVYPISDDTVAVIDGQQRLTTFIMLLCSLREMADSEGYEPLANGTHIFVERTDENDNTRFVLHTESSFPYLHDEIMSREMAELASDVGSEEQALSEAYKRINRYVSDLVQAVRVDPSVKDDDKGAIIHRRLQDVRDKLLGLRIVFIEVGNEDDATTIFVTLNSRGQDLEPADLVKAHLLQLMPKRTGLDRPLEKWQGIIDKFDASEATLDMTGFLVAVWRSRYESRITSKKLTKAIRKRIKKAQAKGFLDNLVGDAELYRQVNEPTYRRWDKNQDGPVSSLQFLRDFQISQPMPLLLSLIREFDTKHITLKQLRRSLQAIEDYHFCYNVLASKTSYGGMSAFFSRRAIDLLNASDSQARAQHIDDLVKELGKRRPSDAEFDEAFVTLAFTEQQTSDKRVIQYILRRFYQAFSGSDVIDFDKMTIEHLMPQSASVGEVGLIGNLIYVSKDLNGNLDSKPFVAKQEILQSVTGEWIPKEILEADSWDADSIRDRTQSLAVAARTKVWRP